MNRWSSPVGPLRIQDGPYGISKVESGTHSDETEISEDQAAQLRAHVEGKPAQLRLDFQGLDLLSQVTLAKVLEIPFGEVRTLQWIAREIGQSHDYRLLVRIVSENPIPVLVPTHRVLDEQGTLIGAHQIDEATVTRLRRFEDLDIEALHELSGAGIQFVGGDGMFHVPTCQKSGQLKKLLRFSSVEEAHLQHLEPCRSCRPI